VFVLLNDAMFCAFAVFCLLNLSFLKASALVFSRILLGFFAWVWMDGILFVFLTIYRNLFGLFICLSW